jgi:hypothetical protein
MSTSFTAFTYRAPEELDWPADILAALAQPANIRHGRLLVFAPSAMAAWRRLRFLRIAPNSLLELKPAHGSDVGAIVAQGAPPEGQVYVLPVSGNTVVEVNAGAGFPSRQVQFVGEIRQGRLHRTVPPDRPPVPAPHPVVSDAMLNAAWEELTADAEISSEELIAAIEAALRVWRDEQPR